MSAGDDIPLDAALIEAFRKGLEQGLNAGLSAAAAAVIAHEQKQEEAEAAAIETAVRSAIDDGVLKLTNDLDQIWTPFEGVECTTDAVADFFYHAEQLATSRGFRRLSARYMVRKGDDEICYEVDGDVNLTPDP